MTMKDRDFDAIRHHSIENLRLSTDILQKFPNNISFMGSVAVAYERTGLLARWANSQPDATKSLNDYMITLKYLHDPLRDDPENFFFLRTLALAYLGVGESHYMLSKTASDAGDQKYHITKAHDSYDGYHRLACRQSETADQKVWKNECALASSRLARIWKIMHADDRKVASLVDTCERLAPALVPNDTRNPEAAALFERGDLCRPL